MPSNDLYIIINYFSSSLSLIALIFSLRRYKGLSKHLKPIFALLVASVLTEILVMMGSSAYELINPLVILKFFTAIEFALISVFYGMFFKKYFNSVVFYGIIPCFFVLNILESLIMGTKSFDNLSISVESICFILYSLFFFYYALENLLFENLLEIPEFWINSAILFYFAGNFFLFLFRAKILVEDPMEINLLWATIHTFFNLVYNLFLVIGFWKTKVR